MDSDAPDLLGIGANCSHLDCDQLDFLPFRCSGCKRIFCQDHRSVSEHGHNCPNANDADVEVIVCPQCARAIKLVAGEDPNVTFEKHSRTACDPSNYAKVHNKKKCPVKGCKEKLTTINAITCKDCGATVCLRHRLAEDHSCPGHHPVTATPNRLRALGSFFGSVNSTTTAAKPSPAKKPGVSPSGSSRLFAAKTKVATVAKQASGSLTAQLQEYRAGHKAKSSPAAVAPTDQPERCPQCGKLFPTVQELIDHAAAVHTNGWTSGDSIPVRPAAGPSAIERCPHCDADFDDPVALVQHVEIVHANKDACAII